MKNRRQGTSKRIFALAGRVFGGYLRHGRAPAPRAVFQPPSVTVQRDRAAHSNANLLFTDPSKRRSRKGELDGADCLTFEEFGVGSEAEGF